MRVGFMKIKVRFGSSCHLNGAPRDLMTKNRCGVSVELDGIFFMDTCQCGIIAEEILARV